MDLRNVLRDLVNTTSGIDFTCIAMSSEDRGDGQRVYMESYTEDRTLVMRAYTKENAPEVQGRFGLGNLGLLQGLMSLKTYSTESTTITPNVKDGVIKSLAFKSDDANTTFMVQAEKLIPAQPRFHEQPYDVQVTPSAAKVQELKSFSGVFKSFSSLVTPYTEGDTLYFHVGEKNKSNHVGALAFSKSDGELGLGFGYSFDRVLQALARVANSESVSLGITKTGMLNVQIDTGIAVYKFYVNGC